MNRVNRLIIGELIGPWLFGVAMFTSLLLAATYLGRITEFIVQGVPPDVVLKITLLFIPLSSMTRLFPMRLSRVSQLALKYLRK